MRFHELFEIEKKPTPSSAGTIKPKPPLTPAQSRKEADRRQKVQQRIRDAQATCNAKVQDLRADL